MNPEKMKMSERNKIESELRRLKDELSDAWWHEEPLSKIEHLEHEIARRNQLLGRPQMAAS